MKQIYITALVIAIFAFFGCAQPPAEAPPEMTPPAETTPPAPTPSSPTPTPTPMPRGTVDPDIHVDIYQPDMVWDGTTLLADNHNLDRPRIIEVNMLGEIIWEYQVPQNLRQYTNPGFDTEWLPNDNILFVLPGNGVYEIERDGNTVWSYLDNKVSHDADRLPNGNTLVVYGHEDKISDAQVKEINPEGEIVWAWYAKDHFNKSPYKDIYNQGWTHTNAASRLPNGNTLISLRNFNFVVEVDPQGTVVKIIGEGIFNYQHDPEMLPSGNILSATHTSDHAVEIDSKTGEVVWRLAAQEQGMWRVRDADRLPNGNTLVTDATKIAEVTPEREIVWLLKVEGVTYEKEDWPRRGFYKAQRIGIQR
ncbi:MAG: aryl-sulfate sulfotransferase [Dehalococcoidia bacterium]|nr:aryl-sulfate sulfotransferase [Dehalococcoidia bacterium]